jgi:3-(3-hydroxy-phenyl)propionate hydroxylase
MVAKGVSWNVGKVFLQNELLYAFDLLPEADHARPAFINLAAVLRRRISG